MLKRHVMIAIIAVFFLTFVAASAVEAQIWTFDWDDGWDSGWGGYYWVDESDDDSDGYWVDDSDDDGWTGGWSEVYWVDEYGNIIGQGPSPGGPWSEPGDPWPGPGDPWPGPGGTWPGPGGTGPGPGNPDTDPNGNRPLEGPGSEDAERTNVAW